MMTGRSRRLALLTVLGALGLAAIAVVVVTSRAWWKSPDDNPVPREAQMESGPFSGDAAGGPAAPGPGSGARSPIVRTAAVTGEVSGQQGEAIAGATVHWECV